jgi:aminoethylphosphonate catabolism LysR family transcriptional regulator
MNHAHLKAFHAVATHLSFTKAAAAIRVSQPTLSGQVKALEARYGVQLFERRGRGIELTELGRALLDVTRRQFAAEAEAENLLASARGLLRGRLRAGADAPYHVIPLLAAFGRRFPGVRRSVSLGNSAQVLADLFAHRTDVAILPEIGPDARLYAVGFRSDRLIAFVERGHPWSKRRSVRLAELAGQPMVLREEGSTTRSIFTRATASTGVALTVAMEIGSREGVREAVAAGLGVGVVNESELGRDDRLHPLAIRDARLEVLETAACLAERRSDPVVDAFFALVEEGKQV